FVGIGNFTRWKKTSVSYLKEQLGKVAIASVALGIGLPLLFTFEVNLSIMLAVALGMWIILCIIKDVLNKCANKATYWQGLRSLTRSYWGMQIAHLGFAVAILGVCITSHYSVEQD